MTWGGGRVSAASQAPVEESHRRRVNTAIARYAAGLVNPGSTIFVNTSSTALQAVTYINKPNVIVITNSGKVQNMYLPPTVQVYVTGGEFAPPKGIMSGGFALETIGRISASLCIMGCAGISERSLTSNSLKEAEVNDLMFERSRRRVVVAGSSKIGRTAGFPFGKLDHVDLLVTDNGISKKDLDALYREGVGKIVTVDPEPGV